jgi:hypothetical protein
MEAMSDEDRVRLRYALRAALPPMGTPADQAHDLLPRLRQRLASRPAPISRFDWALLAALLAGLVVFPETLLLWLYHL